MLSVNPLDVLKEFDPQMLENWKKLQDMTFEAGALTTKTKLLIALSIDVENGAMQGALALGGRALKIGATKDEVVEALRVACSIGGNRALFTSALVLQKLFSPKMTL
jgi:alkylhydroperoxidase/carboxymuconolactone decarboxylase family protein YurZ